MNILVTGSSGFIGTAVVKTLINEGYNVFCLARPNSSIKIKDVNIISIKDNTNQYCLKDVVRIKNDWLKYNEKKPQFKYRDIKFNVLLSVNNNNNPMI